MIHRHGTPFSIAVNRFARLLISPSSFKAAPSLKRRLALDIVTLETYMDLSGDRPSWMHDPRNPFMIAANVAWLVFFGARIMQPVYTQCLELHELHPAPQHHACCFGCLGACDSVLVLLCSARAFKTAKCNILGRREACWHVSSDACNTSIVVHD